MRADALCNDWNDPGRPLYGGGDRAVSRRERAASARGVIERGEMAAERVGQRLCAIPPKADVAWALAHPQRGRRLTNDAPWVLIAELAAGETDWFSPLLRHRTRERIRKWTSHKISDAVSQRRPMPEAHAWHVATTARPDRVRVRGAS